MAYTRQNWAAGEAGGTPLSDTRFDYMEDGIGDAHDLLEGKADKAAPALGKLYAGLVTRTTTPCRVAFAGSSTTAGQNASAAANRYVNRLVTALQAAYPSGLGTETSVVASTSATWGTLSTAAGVHGYNAGEGGTTSATYLTAGEITNIAALNPCAVIHMIGSNDFRNGVPVATYKANVAAAIAQLKAAITVPCVHILVHSFERFDTFTPVAPWDDYGAAAAELADADPNHVAFIDQSAPYRALGVPGTPLDPANLVDTDNTHLTDAGHALQAELLARALAIPGPRASSSVTRTLARVTSDLPSGADDTDIVGRTADALLGGTGKVWEGDGGGLAIVSGALVRGALNAVWFNGWPEPVADVELSFALGALPTGASATIDVHRAAPAGAGTPNAYRIQLNADGTAVLVKRVSGTTTTLTSSVAVAVGDRIGIRYYKGTLALRVGGETRAVVADASLPGKGWCGFSGAANVASLSVSQVAMDVVT